MRSINDHINIALKHVKCMSMKDRFPALFEIFPSEDDENNEVLKELKDALESLPMVIETEVGIYYHLDDYRDFRFFARIKFNGAKGLNEFIDGGTGNGYFPINSPKWILEVETSFTDPKSENISVYLNYTVLTASDDKMLSDIKDMALGIKAFAKEVYGK